MGTATIDYVYIESAPHIDGFDGPELAEEHRDLPGGVPDHDG